MTATASTGDTGGTGGTGHAVRLLDEARAAHRPCPPVRRLLPPGDLDAAYAEQSAWVAGREAAGARVVGRKIGLTNPKVQAQLGVDQPDYRSRHGRHELHDRLHDRLHDAFHGRAVMAKMAVTGSGNSRHGARHDR